jgi:hypothetical protein
VNVEEAIAIEVERRGLEASVRRGARAHVREAALLEGIGVTHEEELAGDLSAPARLVPGREAAVDEDGVRVGILAREDEIEVAVGVGVPQPGVLDNLVIA